MPSSSTSTEDEAQEAIQACLKVFPMLCLLADELRDVYDCLNAYMVPSAA